LDCHCAGVKAAGVPRSIPTAGICVEGDV
jgi:hypothetical protein